MGGRALASVIAISLTGSAHAEVAVDPCACSPNKPGFHRAGALTGDWNGVRSDLFERGVKIQGTYAGELFTSPGLMRDPVVGAGLAALILDLELATLVESHLGSLHVAGFGIHGHGLSEQLMDVYGVSNNVAENGVRLFEAWYEQPLGPFAVRAGLVSADQEFIIASHSTVLLDATFGIIGMLSYNIGGPVYPVATPGVSARFESDAVTVRTAIYDGEQRNEHGLPNALGDHVFAIGEVELVGALKLGAWHHTGKGRGYYGVLDRQLERHVGGFARVSAAPGTAIDLYADVGIRIGPGPLRARDFFSIGLAFARSEVGPQTVAEVTYQYLVTGWLTIQPDLQLVLTRDGTVGVLAARAVVAL